MKKENEKYYLKEFFDLSGEPLLNIKDDGIRWIAIKPLCRAMKVDYTSQFKNIWEDPILNEVITNKMIYVPGDQRRRFACLPEFYIYGWIISIQSQSPMLLQYQSKCYKILYDYFRGSLTSSIIKDLSPANN
jgi:hypothetical protein